jgi:hypothetical protein
VDFDGSLSPIVERPEDAQPLEVEMKILWRPSPALIKNDFRMPIYECKDAALLDDGHSLVEAALDDWNRKRQAADLHNRRMAETLGSWTEMGQQALREEIIEAHHVAQTAAEYLERHTLPDGTRRLIDESLGALEELLDAYNSFLHYRDIDAYEDALPPHLPPWRVSNASERLSRSLDQAKEAIAAKAARGTCRR